jgi:hypothetical protein
MKKRTKLWLFASLNAFSNPLLEKVDQKGGLRGFTPVGDFQRLGRTKILLPFSKRDFLKVIFHPEGITETS